MTVSPSQFSTHNRIPEPELLFHPDRDEDRHEHPLVGLQKYGPYSRALVNHVLDPIRIAAVVPHGQLKVVLQILDELETCQEPRERRHYLPAFTSYSSIFGIRVVPSSNNTLVELPQTLDSELDAAERPHLRLAEVLSRVISVLNGQRPDFDVVLIFLPERWARAFLGPVGEDFDLHDYIKAIAAARGIPVQILQEGGAVSYFCRASVMWRLSIALYCKAGGVPWKLADTDQSTAYVGISYAVRSSNPRKFVTCCSQVFDSDGAGLEFLLYETDGVRYEKDNPFLERGEMRRLMARSLQLYQRRHGGRVPKRVVVHKSTEFKHEEVDGCFDAWRSVEGLELIQVQQDTPWRGILMKNNNGKPVPDEYPCLRGSYVRIGECDTLLWTQGNVPSAVGGRNYYKEGKGIPAPLLLKRFAGHGGWDGPCRAILGLTKMNWNNDSLYDRLPVTLGYASVLARTVKRMPALAMKPYEFRFFM